MLLYKYVNNECALNPICAIKKSIISYIHLKLENYEVV